MPSIAENLSSYGQDQVSGNIVVDDEDDCDLMIFPLTDLNYDGDYLNLDDDDDASKNEENYDANQDITNSHEYNNSKMDKSQCQLKNDKNDDIETIKFRKISIYSNKSIDKEDNENFIDHSQFKKDLTIKNHCKSQKKVQCKLNDDEIKLHREQIITKFAINLVENKTSRHRQINFSVDLRSKIFSSSPRMNWINAVKMIRYMKDPWDKFHIVELPSQFAIRYRYHALRKEWITDQIEVKMETEAFDQGAMRCCFRVKKMPTFGHHRDWKHAHNFVAKRYIRSSTEKEVYFQDVRLQMDAKLWGEEYNRHNPPKKVDIVQMCVLEFKDSPDGEKFYHLEHFIEGHYTKYNSNSGFVDDNHRFTPQAFSHFTFERSGHQLMVVDIQGVGDLWTDPQIHATDSQLYGDGNLGVNGMALYFHSHTCNSICASLGLSEFDLAPNERHVLEKKQNKLIMTNAKSCEVFNQLTRVRGEEDLCVAAFPHERNNLVHFLLEHNNNTSNNNYRNKNTSASNVNGGFFADGMMNNYCNSSNCSSSVVSVEETSELSGDEDELTDLSSGIHSYRDYGLESSNCGSPMLISPPPFKNFQHNRSRRQRFYSESEECSSLNKMEDDYQLRFMLENRNNQKPACAQHEMIYGRIINNQTTDSAYNDDEGNMLSINDDVINIHEDIINNIHRNHFNYNASKSRDLESTKLNDDYSSILGQIHHQLAKYYEMGRFREINQGFKEKKSIFNVNIEDNLFDNCSSDLQEINFKSPETNINQKINLDYDVKSALYHECYAAELGVKEAMVTLASIYLNLDQHMTDVLVEVRLEKTQENLAKGARYMKMAAEAGDRSCMLFLARAYEKGEGPIWNGNSNSNSPLELTNRKVFSSVNKYKNYFEPSVEFNHCSYKLAVHWYMAASQCHESSSDEFIDALSYEILAKMAELYLIGREGDLPKDPSCAGDLFTQAAEAATAAMKGRIANKYYALADEAWALVEED